MNKRSKLKSEQKVERTARDHSVTGLLRLTGFTTVSFTFVFVGICVKLTFSCCDGEHFLVVCFGSFLLEIRSVSSSLLCVECHFFGLVRRV